MLGIDFVDLNSIYRFPVESTDIFQDELFYERSIFFTGTENKTLQHLRQRIGWQFCYDKRTGLIYCKSNSCDGIEFESTDIFTLMSYGKCVFEDTFL